MTRNGKIARLPRAIREQLNRRLADGELGAALVQWLNSLPEVQKVLEARFGGRPINEQNLSEWRQGGFEDWLRHEDARAWVAQLVEESDDLASDSGPIALADRAAVPALLALSGLLQRVLISTDDAEQRRSVIGAAQQLTQLRRVSHQAEKLRLEKERWEAQKEEARCLAEHRAEMQRLESQRLGIVQDEARQDAIFRSRYVPDFEFVRDNAPGNQAESGPIKPNQTTFSRRRRNRTHPRRPATPAQSSPQSPPPAAGFRPTPPA